MQSVLWIPFSWVQFIRNTQMVKLNICREGKAANRLSQNKIAKKFVESIVKGNVKSNLRYVSLFIHSFIYSLVCLFMYLSIYLFKFLYAQYQAISGWASNTLSETKICNLHPKARRRASLSLLYESSPPSPTPETDGHFISFTYDADASEVTVSCRALYSVNLF